MSQEPAPIDSGAGTARTMVAIVATLTGVSAMFVAARLFVRIKLRSLGLDDYLIVLAMVNKHRHHSHRMSRSLTIPEICAFVNLGISSAAAASGSGRHFNTLSFEEKQNVIKYTMAAFCPGVLSFAIPKLAVVALLTKLLNPSPAHRIFLWCSTSVTAIVIFGCVIILYAQCTPSRSQWDFSVEGECWSPWTLVNYSIFAGCKYFLVWLGSGQGSDDNSSIGLYGSLSRGLSGCDPRPAPDEYEEEDGTWHCSWDWVSLLRCCGIQVYSTSESSK